MVAERLSSVRTTSRGLGKGGLGAAFVLLYALVMRGTASRVHVSMCAAADAAAAAAAADAAAVADAAAGKRMVTNGAGRWDLGSGGGTGEAGRHLKPYTRPSPLGTTAAELLPTTMLKAPQTATRIPASFWKDPDSMPSSTASPTVTTGIDGWGQERERDTAAW